MYSTSEWGYYLNIIIRKTLLVTVLDKSTVLFPRSRTLIVVVVLRLVAGTAKDLVSSRKS